MKRKSYKRLKLKMYLYYATKEREEWPAVSMAFSQPYLDRMDTGNALTPVLMSDMLATSWLDISLLPKELQPLIPKFGYYLEIDMG